MQRLPFVLGSHPVQKSLFDAIRYITRSSRRSVSSAYSRHFCRRYWRVKACAEAGVGNAQRDAIGVVKPTPNVRQQKVMTPVHMCKLKLPFAALKQCKQKCST